MASNIPAQISFLTDAAHLLAATAPETSAYLMGRRTGIALTNDLPLPDAQRQHVCTGCGHIMIPGQGATLTFEAGRVVRKSKKRGRRGSEKTRTQTQTPAPTPAQRPGITKVFTCGSCHRQTRIVLPPPAPISRRKAAAPGLEAAAATAASQHSAEAKRPSANASSKKRAKSRKAGLQALLQQSRAAATAGSTATGFGLSLNDFMKKG